MNDAATANLERELGKLTEWEGRSPSLWRRAMAAAGIGFGGPGWQAFWRQPVPGWFVGGAVATVLLVIIGVVSHARFGVATLEHATLTDGRGDATTAPLAWAGGSERGTPAGGRALGTGPAARPAAPAPGNDRQVARKATVELAAQDVRTAFFKACHLVSAVHDEYVQDSSLTSTGTQLRGTLTLRVAVGRLSDVLNQLRTLGEVRTETSSGEDVTAQVVDLEARLRNEQRVEGELLELLQSRADAPLKEILELRTALAAVRQTIERLTAQRERFSGLVSLATVAVILVPADSPPPEPAGFGTFVAQTIQTAWRAGLTFLVETVAGLLAVLVGGLIWWIVLAVIVFAVRARRRRRATPPH